MASVTVIVASYNSRTHLPACLASVLAPQGASFELIVVDNASTDGSAALVADQFPMARLVVNRENRGFAAAVNQGLAQAAGEFVLLLNPDAMLLPGALKTLVDFLEAHSHVAAVGPRQWLDVACTWQTIVVPRPPHWRVLLADWPGLRRLGLGRRQLAAYWALDRAIWRDERPQQVPFLFGACMLLRRSALEAVGGLDEGYFLFFEDVDLCERLRAAGWELDAAPAAGVVHAGMGSVRALPDSGQRQLLASGSRYLARHGDPLTRALWAALRARRAISRRQAVGASAWPEPPAPTLSWPPVPGAVAYWVEVSPDSTFLYAAAARVAQPACTLPGELAYLLRGEPFFWRVAAVENGGQAEPFATVLSRENGECENT